VHCVTDVLPSEEVENAGQLTHFENACNSVTPKKFNTVCGTLAFKKIYRPVSVGEGEKVNVCGLVLPILAPDGLSLHKALFPTLTSPPVMGSE
jgi:hypothetical protein